MNLENKISNIQSNNDFSGTVVVKGPKGALAEASFGYANRSEQLNNQLNTRFGIASGCKLFTSIAICQLAEQGKLSFDTKLKDALDVNFPYFDEDITIHHLLTHTSGIPDYFDEEIMDDYEELWIKNPMYHIRSLKDFLPLFDNGHMKSVPGERFHYNNAGYILLGLIVEQTSGLVFTEYVQERIFKVAGMTESGYFEMDSLPQNTALGYIDKQDGTWKTNIYSLPAKGSSDGGAYVTADDMIKLWQALINFKLLNEESTNKMLLPHAQVKENSFYGYGLWILKNETGITKYHVMGYDPGVSFHSAYYPSSSSIVAVCSNKSSGAFDISKGIEEELTRVATKL